MLLATYMNLADWIIAGVGIAIGMTALWLAILGITIGAARLLKFDLLKNIFKRGSHVGS